MVLGVSGGCGASTVSLAILDAAAAALAQGPHLLDLADPARSGLRMAGAREETLALNHPPTPGQPLQPALMRSWRGPGALVRAGDGAAGAGYAHATSPAQWLRRCGPTPLSVVDFGHDVWPVLRDPGHPLRGWLTTPAATRVVVVAPATRPGLRATEAVFHQLRALYDAAPLPGGRPGLVLVLNGGEPDQHEQLLASASRDLRGLLGAAVRVPVVDSVVFEGLQETPLEPALVAAGHQVLLAADVVAAPPPPPRRRWFLTGRART